MTSRNYRHPHEMRTAAKRVTRRKLTSQIRSAKGGQRSRVEAVSANLERIIAGAKKDEIEDKPFRRPKKAPLKKFLPSKKGREFF